MSSTLLVSFLVVVVVVVVLFFVEADNTYDDASIYSVFSYRRRKRVL